MANVLFKIGSQTDLNKLKAGTLTGHTIIEGAFYLTKDTHRLYVGQNDGTVLEPVMKLHLVSQAVDVRETLPTGSECIVGQIYYLTASNILAIYNGENVNPKWTQLNEDTYLEATAITSKNTDTSGNGATVTFTTQENRKTKYNDDNNQHNADFKIIGGGGVTVTSDTSGTIVVTGAKEKALTGDVNSSGNAEIKLGDTDTVTIVKGDNVTFTDNGNNQIELKTANYYGTSGVLAVEPNSTKATTPATGFKIEGQVNGNNSAAEFTMTSATLDPKLTIKDSTKASGTAIGFDEGKIDLDVYSTAAVDKLIQDAAYAHQAMTYKGTITPADSSSGTTSVLPDGTTGHLVEIGDVYLANKDGYVKVNGNIKKYTAGTMFIAQGTEDSSGHITPATLQWAAVQTSDKDTTSKLASITNGIQLQETNAGGTTAAGQVTFSTGAEGLLTKNVTVTKDSSGNETGINVEYAHATVSITDNQKGTIAATDIGGSTNATLVIGALGHDSYGHVTAITAKKIYSRVTKLEAVDVSTAAEGTDEKNVKVTTSVQDSESASALSDAIYFTSNTLHLTSSKYTPSGGSEQSTVNMDILWEEF